MEVGIFIAKYSFDFKKQLVNEYLTGKGSYKYLSQIYLIPTKLKYSADKSIFSFYRI